MVLRRCLTAAVGVFCSSAALATPLPVIEVVTGDAVLAVRASVVVDAVGADAREAAARAPSLLRLVGEAPPAGDGLAQARAGITQAMELFYATRNGAARARPVFVGVATALEAQPVALVSRPDNAAAYVRLSMLARIAMEARQPDEVRARLARLVSFDPSWLPDPHEHPPDFVAAHRAALEALRASPSGTLTVLRAAPTCVVRVDGQSLATTSGELSVGAGPHRVFVACGADGARVYAVDVAAGARVQVAGDPSFDAALDAREGLRLRYETVERLRAQSAAHAARVGRMLGAARVVVLADTLRVLDASTGALVEESPLARWHDVVARLTGRTSPTNVANADRAAPTRSRVGAWGLLGGGALALGLGAAFFVLRGNALDELRGQCPRVGEQYVCPDTLRPTWEQAQTWDLASGITVGVGAAAVAGGVLWLLLSGGESARPPVRVGLSGRSFVVEGEL